MKDWMLTLAITGIGALVNIAINILFYTFMLGRKLENVERTIRMADEHDKRIDKLELWKAAQTGIANGVHYRKEGD